MAFSPAVTSTTQDVTITIDDLYGSCPVTPDPQLTGGTSHLQLTRPLSCTNVIVTSGLDAGFIATKTVTDPDFSLACNTTGLTTLSGTVTIEFT